MRIRRGIALWFSGVLLLCACTSSSGDSNGDTFSIDRGALGPGAMFFPDDLLTAPGTELDLQPVRDRQEAAAKLIGWRGGKVSATGRDGTVYTLTILPGALAMPTEISLTPLADVEGLPFDEPPEHRLGVEFGPEGLQLAMPALLTVDSARPVDPGALTMSYRAGGNYSGAVASSEAGSRITAEIDHFSGYVMVWPLTEDHWRRLARLRLSAAEFSLVSTYFTTLAFYRQQQIQGIEIPNLLTLAEVWLPEYEEEILNARTAVADSGCGETEQAIYSYGQYKRLTELLGVAENPEFIRPIPDQLFQLQQRLCWEEQFIRCRVSGDFASLGEYFLKAYRQYTILTGNQPDREWIDKAVAYLKRCGRWKVTTTSVVELVRPNYAWIGETYGLRTEYELAWKPSGSDFDLGLGHSTIEGPGKPEIHTMRARYNPPGTPCTAELDPGPVKYEPHAQLTEISFNDPKQEWVPGIAGSEGLSVGGYWRETGPPTLSGLSLALYVPLVRSVYRPHCTISIHETGVATFDLFFVDLPFWWDSTSKGAARLKAAMIRPGDPNFIEWLADSGPSPFGLRFSKGWKVCGQPSPYGPCAAPPFTADQSLEDMGEAPATGTHSIELEVEIEHTPG